MDEAKLATKKVEFKVMAGSMVDDSSEAGKHLKEGGWCLDTSNICGQHADDRLWRLNRFRSRKGWIYTRLYGRYFRSVRPSILLDHEYIPFNDSHAHVIDSI